MNGEVRVVDRSVGEAREATFREGVIVGLRVERWSDVGRRARWGERFLARVGRVDVRRRGAFLDLGLRDEEGFLRCDGTGKTRLGDEAFALVEGALVEVLVRREGARGKSPVVALVGPAPPGVEVGRVPDREGPGDTRAATASEREAIEEALERAGAVEAPLLGGGRLMIEPTAALVAIDVDAGARAGSADPERFACDLNFAAADECVRQIRLRGLGGLIAIDFVSMRRRANQIALDAHMRKAFAEDAWGVVAAPLSRFGVMELARTQVHRPLHEVLLDSRGDPTPETGALQCLRAMEHEATRARGRVVRGTLSHAEHAWLMKDVIGWRAALAERIGPCWEIVAGAPGARRWEVSLV